MIVEKNCENFESVLIESMYINIFSLEKYFRKPLSVSDYTEIIQLE